jgi:hypothetical protein
VVPESEECVWLLGTSWNTAANDAATSKFLTAVQVFVSTSKTDVSSVPGLLGISAEMASLHRKATQSLLHLAILGDRSAVCLHRITLTLR